jgi:hypothetical protein
VESRPSLWLLVCMRPSDFHLASPADLLEALEASWDCSTAYASAFAPGNAALGQCYPTARVVQSFFPRFEIARGIVDTGSSIEAHYWNVDPRAAPPEHADLTRSQFPARSKIVEYELLDRHALGDSSPTVVRCQVLLERVVARLLSASGPIRRDDLGGEPPEESCTVRIGSQMDNLAPR